MELSFKKFTYPRVLQVYLINIFLVYLLTIILIVLFSMIIEVIAVFLMRLMMKNSIRCLQRLKWTQIIQLVPMIFHKYFIKMRSLLKPSSVFFLQEYYEEWFKSKNLEIIPYVSIHKKRNTYDPFNYRPISLTYVGSRILERLICNKVLSYLLLKKIHFPNHKYWQIFMIGQHQLIMKNSISCMCTWI